MKSIKKGIMCLALMILFVSVVPTNVFADKNTCMITTIDMEGFDDPYTGEVYTPPAINCSYYSGIAGSDIYLSSNKDDKFHFEFIWKDIKTGKFLKDNEKFKKGNTYSLTIKFPARLSRNGTLYVIDEEFIGNKDGKKLFSQKNCELKDGFYVVEDIYSKKCVDRPKKKIRINSIDLSGINTKLKAGDDPHAWISYDKSPLTINGKYKVKKGDYIDKYVTWYSFWVELKYDAKTKTYKLAAPNSHKKWYSEGYKIDKIKPNTYYGLIVQYAIPDRGEKGVTLSLKPMLPSSEYSNIGSGIELTVNGKKPAKNCSSAYDGLRDGGGDYNDGTFYIMSYFSSGVYEITKSK